MTGSSRRMDGSLLARKPSPDGPRCSVSDRPLLPLLHLDTPQASNHQREEVLSQGREEGAGALGRVEQGQARLRAIRQAPGYRKNGRTAGSEQTNVACDGHWSHCRDCGRYGRSREAICLKNQSKDQHRLLRKRRQ